MVRALVVSDNINFVQKLLEEINFYELNISIVEISKNEDEVRLSLKNNRYDILFLDKDINASKNKELFKSYRKVIIPLTYRKNKSMISLNNLNNINGLMHIYDMDKVKEKAAKELEYIGYKLHYQGTQYLLESIVCIYRTKNNKSNNLQGGIYPIIAKKYKKTVKNIKSSISKATEIMYYETNSDKIEKYFMLEEGERPTVKQIIFTIINRI